MLTRRAVETLTWIADFIRREGYAPSRAEIGRALGGLTRQTAGTHVSRLVECGFLRDTATGHGAARSRALQLTPAGRAWLKEREAARA